MINLLACEACWVPGLHPTDTPGGSELLLTFVPHSPSVWGAPPFLSLANRSVYSLTPASTTAPVCLQVRLLANQAENFKSEDSVGVKNCSHSDCLTSLTLKLFMS